MITAAWLAVRTTSHERSFLESAIAWLGSLIAIVAASGVLLGVTGGLGRTGFVLLHSAVLIALGIVRKRHRSADLTAAAEFFRRIQRSLTFGTAEGISITVLFVVLVALLLVAVSAEPALYDALTYRLPRIGDWLQTGGFRFLETSDPRLNYMPVVPDLIMGWLMLASTSGYAGIVIAQALGGTLLALGTIGLARFTGLTRVSSVLSALLLFGMANVVPQYTSAHTDLFTAGVFIAAFYLWACQVRRGEGSLSGGIGAGLALGSKGTIFYLVPGALVWVVWLGYSHRAKWPQWRTTILAAVAGTTLFAGPVFFRNWQAYDSILGPRDYIQMHHRAIDSAGELARKLGTNLATTFVQLFEPNSQPLPLRRTARQISLALTQQLPARDADMLEPRGRHDTLREIFERNEPDADVTSFGVVTAALILFGAMVAVTRREHPEAKTVLIWIVGVVVFLVFFHAMQQWHPYGYRYFVLVAPWIAVVGAWALEQVPRTLRTIVWAIALISAANVAWFVTTQTHQVGWRAVVQPERSRGYFVFQHWREWVRTLPGPTTRLTVALPFNVPLAAFFRQPEEPAQAITLRTAPNDKIATAEDFVRDQPGWVVVPASRFMGHEGNVAALTWLFAGDASGLYSVAAYRRLRDGEKALPVLYRASTRVADGRTEHEILVRTWTSDAVCLKLTNLTGHACRYQLVTPSKVTGGDLSPTSAVEIEALLEVGLVSELKVIVSPSTPSHGRPSSMIELVP